METYPFEVDLFMETKLSSYVLTETAGELSLNQAVNVLLEFDGQLNVRSYSTPMS